MRITSKGQVTIPAQIRAKAGLLPQTEVEFTLDKTGMHLHRRKSGSRRESRGEGVVRRLSDSATIRMTTDEIVSLTRGG
jgi:AbrB family looped-hinge helix DNA binding protein